MPVGTLAHGGEVNYKDNPDGSRSVYELNTTLYDFFNDPLAPDMANGRSAVSGVTGNLVIIGRCARHLCP